MNRTFSTAASGLTLCLLLGSSQLASAQEAGGPEGLGGAASSPPLVVDATGADGDVMESVRGAGMDLTADRAAEIAAAGAASVEHAHALLDAARAGADRARNGFVPRLDVIATYTRLPTDDDRLVPNSVSRDIDAVADPAARDLWEQHARVLKDRYSVTSTVTFPVSDYFLELWPRYASAKGFAEAREYGLAAERARVALSAREAYYAYARARAASAVQKRVLAQAEQAAQLVESRAGRGQVNRSDALGIRAELASARAGLLRAEGGVTIAGTALRAMLEIDPETPIALEEDLLAELSPAIASTEVLTRRALGARAEAQALRRVIEARGHAVEAAKGSRLPSLFVQGTAEVGSPNSRLFLERTDPQAIGYVTVGVSWSLEETLQGSPAADEQRAARDQGRADLRGLEEAIRIEVSEARVAYEVALQMRAAAELLLETAQERHRQRIVELKRGRALAAEVLESVAGLAHAEMGLLNAAIDGRIALAKLERAVGSSDVMRGR